MNLIRVVLAVAVFAIVSICALSVRGQGIVTGTLAGTVQDPTGAVVRGATVTATRPDTNAVSTATTNGGGLFSLNDLPVGIYNVKIDAPGFAGLMLNSVRVDANHTLDLGIEHLTTGSAAATTVEVTADSALLETTQAQVTSTFGTEQVANLPIGGGFDELALLVPGVVATHGNTFSNSNGPGYSSNGQRGRSNNFEIDGQANNDNSVAGPQFFFGNEEALDQIQVITNNFSAQYGRDAGSVTNYITKSGTNSFHGSAFYRYSGNFTSSLDTGVSKGPQFGFCASGQTPAQDGCRATVVPRYVYNLYGGNFTAPIIKDKLFASVGVYGTRFFENGGATTSGVNLFPTPAGLLALAAAFPNNPAITILNQLNPFNLQGNPHVSSAPVSQVVTDGTTTVSIPFAKISRNFITTSLDREYLGRLDYQATGKDHFSARYIYQNDPLSPVNATAAGGTVNLSAVTHSIGADWTHIFSPRWVNQLRYSFQQSDVIFDGGDTPSCTINNFTNCPSQIALGNGVPGIGLGSGLPQGRIVKTGQVQNNATWSFGRHSITFGGEFDYQNSPNVFLPSAQGVFQAPGRNDFTQPTVPLEAFSNFLQGIGTTSLTQGSVSTPFKEKDVAAYFQDDWKINSQLTLNIGLRWEFFQQALNLLHDRSVAQQTGPHPIFDTALPLSKTTSPRIPESYRNFEPRFGFAYSPSFDKNLVLRGGYAINVEPVFYNINLNVATNAPVVNAVSFTCTGVATPTAPASCLPNGGATFTTANATFGPFIPRNGDPGDDIQDNVTPNFRQPLTQSYTLGAQFQVTHNAVAEIRYAGNPTAGNFQSFNSNPQLSQVAADFPNFVSPSSLCNASTSTLASGADIGHLHCGSTIVNTVGNTAFSLYNSLQTSLTIRRYHGVTATAGYTFSRGIDNSSEIFGTFGGGNTSAYAQNPLDIDHAERAVSGISYPNVASVSLVYEVPKFGSATGLVSKLINGWQTNTVWIYNSGQPYTDFDIFQNGSPQANGNDPRTFNSYSDQVFAIVNNGQIDTERPILSNAAAPVGSIGIYTTTTNSLGINSAPELVDYVTGAPVTRSQVHWIANNQYAALIAGTPYPGSGRNLLRGDSFNNVDFSVYKNTKFGERVTLRFEADAFNVLNRSYYGAPDAFLADAPAGSFNNFLFNSASGGLVGTGTGVRNITFGAKILF